MGYFRADTVNGKDWFLGTNNTSEELIMNLSLNINEIVIDLGKYPGQTFVYRIGERNLSQTGKILKK